MLQHTLYILFIVFAYSFLATYLQQTTKRRQNLNLILISNTIKAALIVLVKKWNMKKPTAFPINFHSEKRAKYMYSACILFFLFHNILFA